MEHTSGKKKKANTPDHGGCHCVHGQIQTGNLIRLPGHTPLSVGKAKQRVRTLFITTSPKKRKTLVEARAYGEGLPVKKANTDSGNQRIDSETE